ncbi:DUF493 family protein [Polaribacter sp.]|uniref:DUF493 family protein n=1 Tax=Polaribacter sp. TaxID=1920175 RepID=UPI003F6D526D
MSDKNAFYVKLKGQLEDTTDFPSDYMYKFIVPTDGNQLDEVQSVFDNKGAVIKTKKSKTGKYISITIVLKLKNADEVIEYYKKVEQIKGIISL